MGMTSVIDIIVEDAYSKIQGSWISDDGWGRIFSCSEASNFSSFELRFGNYWFEVLADDYVVPVYYDGSGCGICLTASDDDYWLLGSTFMRGYYNIHDHA